MGDIFIPQITRTQVKRDGTDVVVVMDGRRNITLPYDAAILLGKAILTQGRHIRLELAKFAKSEKTGVDLSSHPVTTMGIFGKPKIIIQQPKVR